MSKIPVDAYRFVDVYGDGLERLKNLLEDNGYVVVADIYTYGMPLSLAPYENYGWISLDGAEEKYDEHFKCSYMQLPVPKPMEDLEWKH